MMDQTRRFDEVALRKPGFHEGIRVTLGDGQAWAMPKRGAILYPALGDDGKIVCAGRWTFGRELDRDFQRAIGAEQCDASERVDSMIALAAALLMRNYDLNIGHLQALIPYTPGDDQSTAMWVEFLRAIQGVDYSGLPRVDAQPLESTPVEPVPAEPIQADPITA